MRSTQFVPRNSEFLASEDIKGAGPVTVTIESASRRRVKIHREGERPKDETHGLLKFVGKDKEMIVNVTNRRRIEMLLGTETDDWIGKQLTLAVEQVKGKGGKMVDGIRVQLGAPRSRSAEDV